MWWPPPIGPHGARAKVVSVLAAGSGRAFPFEVHRLAFEELVVAAGDYDDLAGVEMREFVVVPEVAEVRPTSAGRIGGVDDSPTFYSMPNPHRAGGMHVYDGSRR